MLYVTATPIGNLEDITIRAINTLKEADYIVAEDTRHSGILLKKYEISVPTISFHAWSDRSKLDMIMGILREGKKVALITDAGTPGISDPGYLLIKAAADENIPVIPIPGPSAFLAALSASGVPVNQFLYLGFLPLKKGRQKLLDSLKEEKRTIVFYEAPHRIQKTLSELAAKFGDRQIVVARELTKIHEEFFRGTAAQAVDHFNKSSHKGEFVVIIGASSASSSTASASNSNAASSSTAKGNKIEEQD
jgi:16S rRNA (cytidine1402-2'-O)-methyltransferase